MSGPAVGQTVTVWWPATKRVGPATIEVVGKSGQMLVRLPNGCPVWILPDQLRKRAPKP